jgi:hypothetical protein
MHHAPATLPSSKACLRQAKLTLWWGLVVALKFFGGWVLEIYFSLSFWLVKKFEK